MQRQYFLRNALYCINYKLAPIFEKTSIGVNIIRVEYLSQILVLIDAQAYKFKAQSLMLKHPACGACHT